MEKLIILEEIAPGIRGRTIPDDELRVTHKQVEEFILSQSNGTGPWANWVRNLYFPSEASKPKGFLKSLLG